MSTKNGLVLIGSLLLGFFSFSIAGRRRKAFAAAFASALFLLFVSPAFAQFTQQGPKLVGAGALGNARQGRSVCVSADGNTAIIGGPSDSGSTGAAWIWTRSGGVWTQQAKLIGLGAAGNAAQGQSVSLSADGNTAIVGGYQDNSGVGAAWVWTRSGGVWTQQAKLIGLGAAGNAAQGQSVSLSADGNTAIIGGFSDNSNAGAAWVFTRSAGVWAQQGNKLVGSGAVGNAGQGVSVSLSADGNTAIIGGFSDNSYAGAAWVFTRSGGGWTQQGTKLVGSGAVASAWQGWTVSLSADGNTAIVGGYADNGVTGAVWIWTRSGGVWTQQGGKLVGSGAVGNAQQGFSVSLSADGNTALVGGRADNSYAGATWVWTRSGGVWTQQAKLIGLGAAGNAAQGLSVSLSSDGNTAIVGGWQDNNGAGAAWVFAAPPTCTAHSGSSQTLLVGQTAALNGSASSCTDGPPTAYLWTLVSKPSGSGTTISDYTSATASLTPDVAGVYTVSLVVSNGSTTSAPAYTTVTANACAQGLTVYPSRPTAAPSEAVTFTARGGAGSYTWSLTQNQSGATISPSGSTCLYTAGATQGTDILHIADTSCGLSLDVTVTVQNLPPQVTETHFCPNPTSGATTTTLYATFSGSVQGAQYMCLPGTWQTMTGSGTSWQATIPVSNPSTNAQFQYYVRGVTNVASTTLTPQKQLTLYVGPNQTPILLIHGWSLSPQCINDCGNFDISKPSEQYLRNLLVADGYDARIVTGIDSWGELKDDPNGLDNSTFLKNYIDNQGLRGEPVVLVGHSYGGLIIRGFLQKYGDAQHGDYAKDVKDVITIDTPHTGSPGADLLLDITNGQRNPADKALKWLAERNQSMRDGIQATDVPFYEIGSLRRTPGIIRESFFASIGLFGWHDEVVPLASQWGYRGSNGSSASTRTYISTQPPPGNLASVLHSQILGDGNSPAEANVFYSDTFQTLIKALLTLTPASCSAGLTASAINPQVSGAQVIPSATKPTVLVKQKGMATVGVEATVSATIESTLQATFSVNLNGGSASVWLTTPSSTIINPASANGDSIKYDYLSAAGSEFYVYTLRAPAAGTWTVHILPSATDPGGLSYTVNAQSLSTLGMSVAALPSDMLSGDAAVVNATLLKAATPATGATVTATITLPDGTPQALTLYDDGAHEDGTAGDGVYANSYNGTAQSGGYSVAVSASGTDGTLGAWQRTVDTNFNVGRQAGTFTGTYSEAAPDTDLNGRFDSLDITAGVNATESGDYRAIGDLKDQSGNVCASAAGTFTAGAPGNYTVALSFRGQDIFENSGLGPYTLTNLRLYKSGTFFSLSDQVNDAYTTTGSYPSWMNFESKDVPLFRFVKPVMDEVVLGNSYTIQWKTGDGSANAVISLYYDSTGTGFNGTAIAGAQRLRKDDPVHSFTWDMSSLPEGKYYVYALIQDGSFSDAVYGGSIYKTLDTDGDGIPDSWETAHGLDPNNAADSLLDPDADGLNNLQEYQASTDPHVADTDGGGENDGSEVFNGRNPLVGSDDVVAIQLTQVTPSAGTTAGGQQIQLRGVHFLAGATVNFGGVAGTSVQVMDGQNILVTTPAHAAGTIDVHVVNPGGATGTLAGGFTYQPAPGLTSALPGTVPTHGGTTVTLAGSGFTSPMRVLFGSSEGSSVIVGSASSVTAITPVLAAGSLNVTALNQGYQSATLSAAMTAVDIPPVEVSQLSVAKNGGQIALSWTPVTLAQDGYTIQPTAYDVYRSESLPVPIDTAHKVATTTGNVTSWIDPAAGAKEFYLVTALYGSAESP